MKVYLNNSSALSAAAYNSFSGVMELWFRNSGPYSFYGVPSSIFHGLINAESPGKYYSAHIRGNYS